jgi:hypothetical protein
LEGSDHSSVQYDFQKFYGCIWFNAWIIYHCVPVIMSERSLICFASKF